MRWLRADCRILARAGDISVLSQLSRCPARPGFMAGVASAFSRPEQPPAGQLAKLRPTDRPGAPFWANFLAFTDPRLSAQYRLANDPHLPCHWLRGRRSVRKTPRPRNISRKSKER